MTDVVITAAGMATALGDASATAAAIRARLSRFREWPDYTCVPADPPRPEEPLPVVAAFTGETPGFDLPSRLLARALQDLVTSADLGRDSLEGARIFVARPTASPSPHLAERPSSFCDKVAVATGLRGFARAEVAPDGHAAMLLALGSAVRAVRADRHRPCLVAGADSLVETGLLDAFDRQGRLKSRRNLDGFVPGEAASVLLVEDRGRAEERDAPILAVIEGVGEGRESNLAGGALPPSGIGLATALEGASAAGGPPAWVLCDFNGESYRGKEWGFAKLRSPKLLARVDTLWHPADGYGDVGAATGGCLAAVCVRAFARGKAPDRRATLFAGSDDGVRAAVSLVSAARAEMIGG